MYINIIKQLNLKAYSYNFACIVHQQLLFSLGQHSHCYHVLPCTFAPRQKHDSHKLQNYHPIARRWSSELSQIRFRLSHIVPSNFFSGKLNKYLNMLTLGAVRTVQKRCMRLADSYCYFVKKRFSM